MQTPDFVDFKGIEPYASFLTLRQTATTISTYTYDLIDFKRFLDKNHLTPFTITHDMMAKFISGLIARKMAPKTIIRRMAVLKSFYRYLYATQQIKVNPTSVFDTFKFRTPQKLPKPLNQTQRDKLLSSLWFDSEDHARMSLLVLIGFTCGLRVSETCSLKWEDIDFSGKIIRVIHGKGDKERELPIVGMLAEAFKLYRERCKDAAVSRFVFPGRRRTQHFHISRIRVGQLLAEYLESWAPFDRFHYHQLRHTFGTILAENGASLYEIRDLMGHSSILMGEAYLKLVKSKDNTTVSKAFSSFGISQTARLLGQVHNA